MSTGQVESSRVENMGLVDERPETSRLMCASYLVTALAGVRGNLPVAILLVLTAGLSVTWDERMRFCSANRWRGDAGERRCGLQACETCRVWESD